jgi:hypothetical protein
MSSCTSYSASPAVPESPPEIVSTGAAHTATSFSHILGARACVVIRETLADLAKESKSDLLRELGEGQPATAIAGLQGWKQDQRDASRFTRQIAGVEFIVDTGGTALETKFQFKVTDTRQRTAAELKEAAMLIQKQGNRAVNQVLAVAMAKQLNKQMARVQSKVPHKVRATNQTTIQLTAIASAKY